jgi:valyl-tRNA synthetase
MGLPGAAEIPLVLVGADAGVEARAQKWAETVSRLARLSGVSTAASAPASSVQLLVRDSVAALPLAGIIDLAAEAARLEREVAKCQDEIAKVDAKLSNPNFVARAPEEILYEHRERREDYVARMERMLAALARLKG